MPPAFYTEKMIADREFSLNLVYSVALRNKSRKLKALIRANESDLTYSDNLKEFANNMRSQIAINNNQADDAICDIRKWKEKDIDVISYFSDDYPKLLREIPDFPLLIYVKGHIPHTAGISIVGSRIATSYGIRASSRISAFLAANQITVVSGMAKGIDSAAHKAAIDNRGKTVAVLGSGVDIIYPLSNAKLYYDIINNGAVISEFEPGTRPDKWNFPKRNRIISGLSVATIVIEATARSGALITARMAAEQNRTVMAVPGSIFEETSRGTNKLIKNGAVPLINYQTIKDEIGIDIVNAMTASRDVNSESLSNNEKLIYNCLSSPKSADRIAAELSFDAATVLTILTKLEINDFIKKENGRFEKK